MVLKRKVQFKKFNLLNPDLQDTGTRGAGSFDKEFCNTGFFHQWAPKYKTFKESISTYTVALIEDKEGNMHEILPINVKFVGGDSDI